MSSWSVPCSLVVDPYERLTNMAQHARADRSQFLEHLVLRVEAIRAVVGDFGRLDRETPQSRTRPAQLRLHQILNSGLALVDVTRVLGERDYETLL